MYDKEMLPTLVIVAMIAWFVLWYLSFPEKTGEISIPFYSEISKENGLSDVVLPPAEPAKVASITSATTHGVPVVGTGGTPISTATGLPPPDKVTLIPTAAPMVVPTLGIIDAKSGDVTPKAKVMSL